MHRFLTRFLPVSLAVLVVSCQGGQPDTPLPMLKTISVVEEVLVMPESGTADIHFKVTDQLFRFAGVSDLVLTPTAASASIPFVISGVFPDTSAAEGCYVATLTGTGGGGEYSVEVRLGVREKPGAAALVLSAPFVVTNTGQRPGIYDTGLPVIRIDTQAGASVRNKVDWVPATMNIDGADYSCSIRGRGNSTWEWPKKPYAIKLDKKAELLGMPAHKRWVLLANFMDRTLMRNIVSMKVAALTSLAWTPSCESVELVLNGKHQGNYLLIEQVKVDDNRVAIDSEEGFLLELDFHYDNEIQWMDPHGRCRQFGSSGIPFGIKHPDSGDITPGRVSEIKNYISEVASVLYGTGFADPDNGYRKYLDVDSFVDYWIVFEVMGNHELGNPGSVFMHKDKGGKLTAGPCWDFDWGVLSYKYTPQARTGLINDKAIWYERLMADPWFRAKVKARFSQLLPALNEIPAFIEETEKSLKKSADINFEMWNPAGDATQNNGSIINGDENMSFHAASVLLREIFEERLEVIRKSL
jgi:hypothetical protein